jgi:PhnB protein
MSEEDNQGPASGLTPHLQINHGKADEAIAFYKKAFGATEVMRIPADDGVRLMHAHLHVNGGSLMLHDTFPEYVSAEEADDGPPRCVTLHLQVDDADTWYNRAVAAGAISTMPLDNMFWGDRYGQVKDPFGHSWAIGAPVTVT